MTHAQEHLSALFDWLLGSTFQAGILIVLILLLQAVLRRRLEARWYCLLWLIVAIRMALPWAPQSRLSLFNWVPSFAETPASEPAPVTVVADTPPVYIAPSPAIPLAPIPDQPAASSSELATAPQPLVGRLPLPRRIAEWLWLAAAAGLACWATFVNARFWTRIRGASVVTDAGALRLLGECSHQMDLKSPPRLLQTDAVTIPSLYGLLRPRLLVPPGFVETLSTEQLRHVFLHEMAHLKRLDTAAGLLTTAVQILHWFNPFAWLAFRRMRADREIACDAMVLSRLQPGEARAYAQTLIKLAERLADAPRQPGVTGILEGWDNLERRITVITRSGTARRGSSMAGLALIGIIGCAALTNARIDSGSQPATVSFSPDKSYVIAPGQGIDVIQVGDNAKKIEAAFGPPPKTEDTGGVRSLNYRDRFNIDFLLDKGSDRVIEIRFDTGFRGGLPDGTRLGDPLDDVVARHGGAKRTVDADREQTHNCALGNDRVLYRQHSRGLFGGLAKTIAAYKFIDGPQGILYWFDKDKKMTQLVVFQPHSGRTGEQAVIPETSHIDASGRIVDKIDYPFVDDPEAVGKWESVDFVKSIEGFNSEKPQTPREKLFLKGLVFYEGGRSSFAWKGWTKGLVMHEGDKTASRYVIKDVDGTNYMFFEWKSGDYIFWHRKPPFYVLKKLPADSTRFDNPLELYATDRMGPKAELSPDSRIDRSGRIIDKTDYPFVDDPQVHGKWESVDFVQEIKDFNPARPKWKDDLFLKELTILPNGRTFRPWWTWTKGMVFHSGDRTASKYTLKEINGSTYMFFEWKSGDYSIMHRRPQYYVLKKTSSDTASLEQAWAKLPTDAEFARTLQSKVDQLDISKATLEDVTKLFGEPGQYLWGSEEFTRDQLPQRYVMFYPAGFRIAMYSGRIGELRFERPGLGYVFDGKLKLGSSLEDALKVLGPPTETVTGKKCEFKDRVLYQDMNGRTGYGYYSCQDRNVRMFFDDDKIIALYVTRPVAP